jgi:hypothetical protein
MPKYLDHGHVHRLCAGVRLLTGAGGRDWRRRGISVCEARRKASIAALMDVGERRPGSTSITATLSFNGIWQPP